MPDPNLKAAVEEINEILKRRDIAGMIFLASPTHTEVKHEFSPSWSCAKMEGPVLRIRAKQEDYPSKEHHQLAVTNTTGMLLGFSDAVHGAQEGLANIMSMLAKHFEIEHRSVHEGETTQIETGADFTTIETDRENEDIVQCNHCGANAIVVHESTCSKPKETQ